MQFWSAWEGDMLVGVGALRRLSGSHGEIKSMHVVQGSRRSGAGSAILLHIIDAARAAGMTRLSLETGSWAYFQPARALYRRHGFVECPPFGDYTPDPNSIFMTVEVRATRGTEVGIRSAIEGDLAAISALTAENRRRLAAWEPWFWRASEQADVLHPLWLGHLVRSHEVVTRVATRSGEVIGFAASNPQPGQYFVDDVCVADDDDWATAGVALFEAVAERPAFSSLPCADASRRRAAARARLEAVSSFRALDLGSLRDRLAGTTTVVIPRPSVLAPAPASTIVLPEETRVFVGDDRGGYAVGSSPFAPPPIYDTGGTGCVIDRVVGNDRRGLLLQVLRLALDRGDTGAVVVVDRRDAELAEIADALGARHPVDIYRWPDPAG